MYPDHRRLGLTTEAFPEHLVGHACLPLQEVMMTSEVHMGGLGIVMQCVDLGGHWTCRANRPS